MRLDYPKGVEQRADIGAKRFDRWTICTRDRANFLHDVNVDFGTHYATPQPDPRKILNNVVAEAYGFDNWRGEYRGHAATLIFARQIVAITEQPLIPKRDPNGPRRHNEEALPLRLKARVPISGHSHGHL